MLLFLVASALSAPITAERTTVSAVAEHFATTSQPISVGCDTDPVAIRSDMTGWKPSCSHGTLTEVSNWIVNVGSTEIETHNNDHAAGETYRVIEAERKRFASPKTVLRVWSMLKPVALEAMQLSSPEHRREIATYIDTALIPAFVYNVPPQLHELWFEEAFAYKTMLASRNPTTEAAYQRANLAFGNAAIAAGFKDPMALQWRYRREEEGGYMLVAAYLGIFSSFAFNIEGHWF